MVLNWYHIYYEAGISVFIHFF